MSSRDEKRLEDMLRAIDSIEEYCPTTKDRLETREPLLSHVVLKLMHVGEAASGLEESVRARAPEVPWSDIIGMRNILVHEYDSVDIDIVWEVVQSDLPSLKRDIQELLRQLRDRPDSTPGNR